MVKLLPLSVCLYLNQYGLGSESSVPGCSKLTTSLVNFSLKFPTFISEICQYFLLKKYEKLLHCKSFYRFCNKKYTSICL